MTKRAARASGSVAGASEGGTQIPPLFFRHSFTSMLDQRIRVMLWLYTAHLRTPVHTLFEDFRRNSTPRKSFRCIQLVYKNPKNRRKS